MHREDLEDMLMNELTTTCESLVELLAIESYGIRMFIGIRISRSSDALVASMSNEFISTML